MDNPSSHLELDSEPLTKSPVELRSGSERSALFAGLLAAVIWFVLVEIIFYALGRLLDAQIYWSLLLSYKLSWVVSAILALAHGIFVGCVTSSMTHSRPYAITIVVITFANVGCLQNIWGHLGAAMVDSGSLSLFWPFIFVVLPILSVLGALNGAWLAQASKQRRAVGIR
jgi:hypothetical protein